MKCSIETLVHFSMASPEKKMIPVSVAHFKPGHIPMVGPISPNDSASQVAAFFNEKVQSKFSKCSLEKGETLPGHISNPQEILFRSLA